MAARTAPERAVGELLGDLAAEARTLIRQEVQLATAEIKQKASSAGKRVALIAGGALLAVIAVMTLTAGIVLLLGRWIPLWASALFVASALGALAYLAVRTGLRALAALDLRPRETLASLKDTQLWLRRQLQ